jgi:hypothetical protein
VCRPGARGLRPRSRRGPVEVVSTALALTIVPPANRQDALLADDFRARTQTRTVLEEDPLHRARFLRDPRIGPDQGHPPVERHVRAQRCVRMQDRPNRIDDYLVRWLVRKYKRFKWKRARAREALGRHARLFPGLFAHWKLVKP